MLLVTLWQENGWVVFTEFFIYKTVKTITGVCKDTAFNIVLAEWFRMMNRVFGFNMILDGSWEALFSGSLVQMSQSELTDPKLAPVRSCMGDQP